MDITSTTNAKSDQLNADDIIGQTVVIKITGEEVVSGDQPFNIYYTINGVQAVDEKGKQKAYKPNKTMRRIISAIWGKDVYVGRYMTLFRNEKVTWGAAEVGGIEISRMSHMERVMSFSLMVSSTKKKTYTIYPMDIPNEEEPPVVTPTKGAWDDWPSDAGITFDQLKAWMVSVGLAKLSDLQKSDPDKYAEILANPVKYGELVRAAKEGAE